MEPEHTAGGRARAKSAKIIETGAAVLGIELGSTRIKACLIAPDGVSLATGSSEWENRRSDGHWTYGLDEVGDGKIGRPSCRETVLLGRAAVPRREEAQ